MNKFFDGQVSFSAWLQWNGLKGFIKGYPYYYGYVSNSGGFTLYFGAGKLVVHKG